MGDLIERARQCATPISGTKPELDEGEEQQCRGNAAQRRIQQGQVSWARHELTGATLAPRTRATLDELQQKRPQEQRREIPQPVLDFNPDVPLSLNKELFVSSLRSFPSGSAAGSGGCTNEILRVCLDDAHVLQLLHSTAEDFARGETPASRPFFLKKDGGVRGIATESSFRRLVAKTLARQFGRIVEQECAPFQFALSTRAGTDCVGHAMRAMTDLNSRATVLFVDGIGAYDHVLRSSMLGKLLEVPRLRGLIPFARTAYAQPTSYKWGDQQGSRHQIWQHEGGEQGDNMMPLLFCLAVHNPLTAIQDQLTCLRSWTIFMWCLSQSGRVPSSTLSLRSWVRAQESSCMQARPGCGTGRAIVLPTWRNSAPMCGALQELKSWGLQLERQNLSTRSVLPDWWKRTNYGRQSSGSLICNALGRSPMPSLFEDHAAISFLGVCGRPQCGDATRHGIFVGRVARQRPSARRLLHCPCD